MNNWSELKRLAEASRVADAATTGADEDYLAASHPENILLLITEHEQFRAELAALKSREPGAFLIQAIDARGDIRREIVSRRPFDPAFTDAKEWLGDFSARSVPLYAAPPVSADVVSASRAHADVLAERRRQVEKEGWTPERDDHHVSGELADAAACYALWGGGTAPHNFEEFWPWDRSWLKLGTSRQMLVKAGALILAEIERMDRAMLAQSQEVKP